MQFAQPGWQYIDTACGHLTSKGSHVTLKSLTSGDYSVVVETVDATAPQRVEFHTSGNLPSGVVHVWQTNASRSFEHLSDITPQNSSFSLTLDPASLYSLTTTTGRAKGTASRRLPRPFSHFLTGRTSRLHRSAAPRVILPIRTTLLKRNGKFGHCHWLWPGQHGRELALGEGTRMPGPDHGKHER